MACELMDGLGFNRSCTKRLRNAMPEMVVGGGYSGSHHELPGSCPYQKPRAVRSLCSSTAVLPERVFTCTVPFSA